MQLAKVKFPAIEMKSESYATQGWGEGTEKYYFTTEKKWVFFCEKKEDIPGVSIWNTKFLFQIKMNRNLFLNVVAIASYTFYPSLMQFMESLPKKTNPVFS